MYNCIKWLVLLGKGSIPWQQQQHLGSRKLAQLYSFLAKLFFIIICFSIYRSNFGGEYNVLRKVFFRSLLLVFNKQKIKISIIGNIISLGLCHTSDFDAQYYDIFCTLWMESKSCFFEPILKCHTIILTKNIVLSNCLFIAISFHRNIGCKNCSCDASQTKLQKHWLARKNKEA